eukprot:1334827-Amorphochlora_amoeboformis.AAC.1
MATIEASSLSDDLKALGERYITNRSWKKRKVASDSRPISKKKKNPGSVNWWTSKEEEALKQGVKEMGKGKWCVVNVGMPSTSRTSGEISSETYRTGCARTLNPRVTNTKDMKEIAVGHNDGGLQGGKEQNLATNSCDKEQKAKPAGDNENEIVTSAGGT